MALVTLRELRRRSRARADFLLYNDVKGGTEPDYSTSFVPNEEINELINIFSKEYYNVLIQADGEDYFMSSLSYTSSTSINLPSDFFKLDSIVVGDRSLLRATQQEFRNNKAVTPSGGTITINYVPLLRTLVDTVTDSTTQQDTIDGINGFEEYIVIRTAMALLTKEQNDISELLSEFKLIQARMEQLKEDRDEGQADIIQDVRSDNFTQVGYSNYYSSGSTSKYRISGGVIYFINGSGYGGY